MIQGIEGVIEPLTAPDLSHSDAHRGFFFLSSSLLLYKACVRCLFAVHFLLSQRAVLFPFHL